MANHKSALKRIRQNERRRLRNKMRKTRIKNLIKKVESAVAEKSYENAQNAFLSAQKYIDKIGKTSTLHRKTASRKVARLARLVNSLKMQQQQG